jgi:pyridoxamine 5'-phosphate oxidase
MRVAMNPEMLALKKQAWHWLIEATRNRRSSFRTMILGTAHEGLPELRTVTLRGADAAQEVVWFHVDLRSPKVTQMRNEPRVAMAGYGLKEHFQIRLKGIATIHDNDDIAEIAWQHTPMLARRCYLAPFGPSTVTEEFEPNVPTELMDREPTEEESAPGFVNFGVARIQVTELDAMETALTGHRRALFREGQAIGLAP